MKIKELFKEMEKANQFAEMIGSAKPYYIWVAIDGGYGAKFDSWKEFDSYIKNEYTNWYVPQLYAQEINLDSKGCADCFFECDVPFGKPFESSIQLAIVRNY